MRVEKDEQQILKRFEDGDRALIAADLSPFREMLSEVLEAKGSGLLS
jgi:hypothetical protein